MKTILSVLMIIAIGAGAMPGDVHAEGIRVKCEKRPARSKISVDAKDLIPGDYRCQVQSGSNQKTAELVSVAGDELECDFDSARGDVLAGATEIPLNFIQNHMVTGKLIDATGYTVALDTVRCRRK